MQTQGKLFIQNEQGGKTKSLPLQNSRQFPKYCNFFSDSLGYANIEIFRTNLEDFFSLVNI